MSRTVPEAKLLGRAILGSIALGGVAECLEIETGGGGHTVRQRNTRKASRGQTRPRLADGHLYNSTTASQMDG